VRRQWAQRRRSACHRPKRVRSGWRGVRARVLLCIVPCRASLPLPLPPSSNTHIMRFLSLSLRLVALVALARAQYSNQIIMDDPAQPPAPLTRPQPSLADLLTIDQSVSIFYSYLRDTGMTARLDDAAVSTTVLAPKNRAVVALPVKPYVHTLVYRGVLLTANEDIRTCQRRRAKSKYRRSSLTSCRSKTLSAGSRRTFS
jgi:hypothetical protein